MHGELSGSGSAQCVVLFPIYCVAYKAAVSGLSLAKCSRTDTNQDAIQLGWDHPCTNVTPNVLEEKISATAIQQKCHAT